MSYTQSIGFFRVAGRAMVLVAIAASLSGCGASERTRVVAGFSGTDLSSIAQPGVGTECNTFSATGVRLAGKATTYYYNGTPQDDKIRLRFTGIDDRFASDSEVFVKFYRWQATSETPSMDSSPVSLVVEKGATNTFPISTSLTQLSMNDVHGMRASGGVSGTTAQEFFDQTIIVLSGLDMSWQALKVVLYKAGTVLGQIDFLIPAYTANPTTYGNTHPMVLNILHPFWSQRTQTLTDAGWIDRARAFCF